MRKICIILAFLIVILAFAACSDPAGGGGGGSGGGGGDGSGGGSSGGSGQSTPSKPGDIAVTGVSLNKSSATFLVNGLEYLTATITPSNATNQSVTWSSSNTAAATVSAAGVVVGVGPGTATITVTTVSGGKKAACTVTVNPINVTGVSMEKSSTSILVGNNETLYAIVTPDNATNKNVTWQSNNTSIATVSATGTVTAVAAGTATITVTTVDGGKTASCTVNVSNVAVPVTGVSLNKTSASLVFSGTEDLTATITPSNATNQNITWSSSNTAVATVSAAGVVTAIKVGTANITVTTADGGKTASCNITVNPKVITFTIDTISAQTYTGSEIRPTVTVRDGSTALTLTTDYTVAYTNNTNAGTATVTVSGAGNYAGSSGSRTFTINKATGAAVSVPTLNNVTQNSITINAVSAPGNGQTIEYSLSTTTTVPSSGWQDSTTFYGLSTGTTYYIFARSKETTNYYAGTPSNSGGITTLLDTPLNTLWTKTITAGGGYASFNAVAVDSNGNIYAAGRQGGGNYSYESVNIAGTSNYANPVLVKYDSSGTVQWARTITASNNNAYFSAVAVDSSGNVYAAGYQDRGNYNYGNVNIEGPCSRNPVLVKYNSSGTAQWAKTITAGDYQACFYAVAVDSGGNVYAAGSQDGTGNYNYGSGNIAGTAYENSLLVKYNSSGTVQWAKTITAGTGYMNNDITRGTIFSAVAVDSGGNVYAAGYQYNNGNYDYGSGNITGTVSSGPNPVLVKYNSSGTTQWAKTLTKGSGGDLVPNTNPRQRLGAIFYAVAVDSGGNVYAAGYQAGSNDYNYGSGDVRGTSSNGNPVLVKYNSSGTDQWAKTITNGSRTLSVETIPSFSAVAVDSGGNVYATGIHSKSNYNYGSGNIAGICENNPVLVKYNSSGSTQWTKTITAGTGNYIYEGAFFNAVAVYSGDNVYAAGYQVGTGNFNYGSGNIAGSSSYNNPVLVKYGK